MLKNAPRCFRHIGRSASEEDVIPLVAQTFPPLLINETEAAL